jgi:NAD(P)-dependent dehydrogenase (short-subunit alcohol dehydrogenase family)
MKPALQNKIALVTGAATGIGRATARALAQEQAKVMVSDVNVEAGKETAALIEQDGGTAVFVEADVSNRRDVENLVRATVKQFGRLDCACNNAGIAGQLGVAAADYPEEVFDKVLAVNLKGVWLCMKYEIPQMLEQGGGSIVNMASAAGLVGLPNAAYTASKHGVVGLTKSAAITYSRQGVRVNAVCPGYVPTPAVTPIFEARPEMEEKLVAQHPIGRLGTEDEIAAVVVWLCSDAASFVCGHALAADGGMVIQ